MLIRYQLYPFRFSGTIVGLGDTGSSGWADSEWRSLKVNIFLLGIYLIDLLHY